MKPAHLLLIALFAAPIAAAQVPATDFEMASPFATPYLNPSGSTEVPVEITIGCALILQGLEQSDIALTAAAPEWISVDASTIAVSLVDCAGDDDAIITKTGAITLTPTDAAPGLTPFNLDLEASFTDVLGSATTATQTIEGIAVDYVPGHILSPAGDQTFQVQGESHTFSLDIEIQANARTMVMFENRVVSGGTLNGVTHKIFEVPDGDRSTTYTVTWNAPDGAWTEETVSFYNYSHCLDRDGCDPNNESNPVWTFLNADPKTGGESSSEGPSEGTPGPGVLLVLALIGFASRLRR